MADIKAKTFDELAPPVEEDPELRAVSEALLTTMRNLPREQWGKATVIVPASDPPPPQSWQHAERWAPEPGGPPVPAGLVADDPRAIDPNAAPSVTQGQRWATFRHPDGNKGVVMYDQLTLRVKDWAGYNGKPISLPPAFMRIPQPLVATCSPPGGDNRGCDSWSGCPYRGHGPFNIICFHKERPSVLSAFKCCDAWTGYDNRGKPISQNHALLDGWVVDTTRRTIPYVTTRISRDPDGRQRRMRYAGEYEVKNLGPMYFNTPPAVLLPEVSLGEISLHDALVKYQEPSEREVKRSGLGAGDSQQASLSSEGSGHRAPDGRPADGNGGGDGNQGHGAGLHGADGGAEGIGGGGGAPAPRKKRAYRRRKNVNPNGESAGHPGATG